MRPAPPDPSSPEDDLLVVPPGPSETLGNGQRPPSALPRNSHRSPLGRIAVAAVALAIVGAATVVVMNRGGSPTAAPPTVGPSSPASPTPPPHVAFVFPLTESRSVSTGGGGGEAAQRISIRIQTTLSAFYDAAFLDPAWWTDGIPEEAWKAFEGPLRGRAMDDADSMTLGDEGPSMASLDATDASLSVHFLFDPHGTAEAAVADVEFKAEGLLKNGEGVRVTNHASFILRPFDGEWLIVGYPSATTKIKSIPASSVSPTPTGPAPTGSASP